MAAISIEPVSLVAGEAQADHRVARRAVKYPGATVFFLDEGGFPEPDAFWVGGARQATLVVQPTAPAAPSCCWCETRRSRTRSRCRRASGARS